MPGWGVVCGWKARALGSGAHSGCLAPERHGPGVVTENSDSVTVRV